MIVSGRLEGELEASEGLRAENSELKVKVVSQEDRLAKCQRDITETRAHLEELEKMAHKFQEKTQTPVSVSSFIMYYIISSRKTHTRL